MFVMLQRNTIQVIVVTDGVRTFTLIIYGLMEWYRASASASPGAVLPSILIESPIDEEGKFGNIV